jgi:SAM-dependent methyltransferase
MTQAKVNLACGGVYVAGDGWINLDYSSNNRNVQRADLLGSLPLADNCASIVYSSHFLEHIPRDQVNRLLLECFRILKPGGILRLVVPDLDNLCRTYLAHRDRGLHEHADFVVLEIFDQCVRRVSGGELARLHKNLQANPQAKSELIAFVRERTGEDLLHPFLPRTRSLGSILRRSPEFVERVWTRAVLQLLPKAFREQNVSLAKVGERHQWLYDEYQLRQVMNAAGFEAIERVDSVSSRFAGFPFYPLDVADDGKPRKGAESLYLEAIKT